jgi:hypothetical protein
MHCRALGGSLLGVLLLSACQSASSPQAPTAHPVRYELEWAWDDVKRAADESSWDITNDLGYRVHVTRGYVTSYSMELVECPKDVAPTPLARLDTLLWSIVEGTAYAGHATGTPNPAAIHPMQVESLTAAAPHQFPPVFLLPQAYCKLHYLVARAGPGAPGLPADFDMVDKSLHVDGSYEAAGTAVETPFTLDTASAYGALFDHAANASAAMHVDTGTSAIQVTIRRHLGKMFDGVDFAKMTPRMAAGQVLKSLIDHVEVDITSGNEKE